MRQSVLGQAVSIGSSGVGFAFRIATINEVDAERNICRASDFYTNEALPLGLQLRGDSSVWPVVGDVWLVDRSMGMWALKSRITETSPPSVAGDRAMMDPGTSALIDLFAHNGMLTDHTTGAADDLYVFHTPALLNGWLPGHLDTPVVNTALRYRRLPGARVELNGWLHGGTTTTFTPLWVLPDGYVPLYDQIVIGWRQDTFATCVVKVLGTLEGSSPGQVQILSGTGAVAGANFHISGSFPLT